MPGMETRPTRAFMCSGNYWPYFNHMLTLQNSICKKCLGFFCKYNKYKRLRENHVKPGDGINRWPVISLYCAGSVYSIVHLYIPGSILRDSQKEIPRHHAGHKRSCIMDPRRCNRLFKKAISLHDFTYHQPQTGCFSVLY